MMKILTKFNTTSTRVLTYIGQDIYKGLYKVLKSIMDLK